jgi:hypothetical protein
MRLQSDAMSIGMCTVCVRAHLQTDAAPAAQGQVHVSRSVITI